jgi:hypothetical protein
MPAPCDEGAYGVLLFYCSTVLLFYCSNVLLFDPVLLAVIQLLINRVYSLKQEIKDFQDSLFF